MVHVFLLTSSFFWHPFNRIWTVSVGTHYCWRVLSLLNYLFLLVCSFFLSSSYAFSMSSVSAPLNALFMILASASPKCTLHSPRRTLRFQTHSLQLWKVCFIDALSKSSCQYVLWAYSPHPWPVRLTDTLSIILFKSSACYLVYAPKFWGIYIPQDVLHVQG